MQLKKQENWQAKAIRGETSTDFVDWEVIDVHWMVRARESVQDDPQYAIALYAKNLLISSEVANTSLGNLIHSKNGKTGESISRMRNKDRQQTPTSDLLVD